MRAEYWLARTLLPKAYANDALICFNSYAFVDDPDFQRAYQRGARALGERTGISGNGGCTSGCGRPPAPVGLTVISSSVVSVMGF